MPCLSKAMPPGCRDNCPKKSIRVYGTLPRRPRISCSDTPERKLPTKTIQRICGPISCRVWEDTTKKLLVCIKDREICACPKRKTVIPIPTTYPYSTTVQYRSIHHYHRCRLSHLLKRTKQTSTHHSVFICFTDSFTSRSKASLFQHPGDAAESSRFADRSSGAAIHIFH